MQDSKALPETVAKPKKRGEMMRYFFFATIIVAAGYTDAFAQEWVRRYNGPDNDDDCAYAIAVDNAGNVYVTGWSYDSVTYHDYATIKYDSSGNEVWIRRYNGTGNGTDYATAIAVDNAGNVYVTGRSEGSGFSFDYATIKYNSAGDTLWVRRYNGPGYGANEAYAITVDNYGNVYVTGASADSGTALDYATIKYDSNGNELWVKRYNGPGNGCDYAIAIAVDNFGNVYVTGRSEGSGTSFDYATVKYSASGDELWVKRYNGPVNDYDEATAIAVDNAGYVYVTGYSMGSFPYPYYNYATVKYSASGDTLWVRRYIGPGGGFENDDRAYAIAVDNAGNVYVTGRSICSSTYTYYDYATVKYSASGDELWVKRYNGPEYDDDCATAIALDNDYVYVTGRSIGSGTYYDYATIKYDANGNELWVRRYNGPADSTDRAYAIAVDNAGYVYVTGYSVGSGTDYDYTTIKYSAAGVEERDSSLSAQNDRLEVHPNPCYGRVNISYYLPSKAQVRLKLYDLSGSLVKVIYEGEQSAGYHEIASLSLAMKNSCSGIYFLRLDTQEAGRVSASHSCKLIVLK